MYFIISYIITAFSLLLYFISKCYYKYIFSAALHSRGSTKHSEAVVPKVQSTSLFIDYFYSGTLFLTKLINDGSNIKFATNLL